MGRISEEYRKAFEGATMPTPQPQVMIEPYKWHESNILESNIYNLADKLNEVIKALNVKKTISPPDQPQGGGRWEPTGGERMYFVSTVTIQNPDPEDVAVHVDSTNYYQRARWNKQIKSGNYFRTREQAEAAAEAIRAVLAYIQHRSPDAEPHYGKPQVKLFETAEAARRTVQNHTKDKED
jgi:hypothetical protein